MDWDSGKTGGEGGLAPIFCEIKKKKKKRKRPSERERESQDNRTGGRERARHTHTSISTSCRWGKKQREGEGLQFGDSF